MALRCSAYIATSLDGFIAREDGNLDWLTGQPASNGGDYGYSAFMAAIDALVMGRKTFEKVLTFGAWPYAGKRAIVLSCTLPIQAIPEALRHSVEVRPGPIDRLVTDLQTTGLSRIYVDGGKTIQGFLAQNLLDDIVITRIPVLLGKGISLFGGEHPDIFLDHQGTQAYDNGLVQSTYRIKRNRA